MLKIMYGDLNVKDLIAAPFVFSPREACDFDPLASSEEKREQPMETFKAAVTLQEQKLTPSTVKIAYPIVSNMKNATLQYEINTKIINMVGNSLKNQLTLGEDVSPDILEGKYSIPLNTKNLLSILFDLYVYSGGVHGLDFFSSITLDLLTGKEITLSDLFLENVDFRFILTDLVKKQIKEKDIYLLAPYEGVKEDQQFHLTEDTLVLYYPIYMYTPYAYGPLRFPIPYENIASILNKKGPIGRLLSLL